VTQPRSKPQPFPPGFAGDLETAMRMARKMSCNKRMICAYAQLALNAKYNPPVRRRDISAAIDPSLSPSFGANLSTFFHRNDFCLAYAKGIAEAIGTRFKIRVRQGHEPPVPPPPPFHPPATPSFLRTKAHAVIVRPPVPCRFDHGDPPPGRSALDQRRHSEEAHSGETR